MKLSYHTVLYCKMNLHTSTAKIGVLILLVTAVLNTGCKHRNIPKKEIISFKALNGIDYTEVYRRLQNGLGFNSYGYEMEPQWKLKFLSDDSVRIYSPVKKTFINFPLTRGYDSIFNTARTWYKVRKMSKDSLVFEILKAKGDSLERSGNKVYLTFYADNYVKNVLHTDTATLRHHSRRDSLYIKSLVAKANANPDSAFAARQPAQLISKSPFVTVNQNKTEATILNNFDPSDDYLSPEFNITINKAYSNFSYHFSVYVDYKGQLIYGRPLTAFTEKGYEDEYIRLSKGVMNTYLKYYLRVIPGSTLGMTHTSAVAINVKGLAKHR